MAWTVPFIVFWAHSSSLFIKRSIFAVSITVSTVCMSFYCFVFFPSPALILHHFLDESRSSIDGEGEESSSNSGIYMPP
jgi:hypothetical protein